MISLKLQTWAHGSWLVFFFFQTLTLGATLPCFLKPLRPLSVRAAYFLNLKKPCLGHIKLRGQGAKKIHLLLPLGPKSILISYLHQTRDAKILKHGILILFNGKKLWKGSLCLTEWVRSLARGLSHLRSKYIQWQQRGCQGNLFQL